MGLRKHGKMVSCSLARSNMNVGFVGNALKATSFRLSSSHMESWQMRSLYARCPKDFPPDPCKKLFNLKKMECLIF